MRVRETEGNDESDVKELVMKAKDEVLRQVEEKGYMAGIKKGQESGEKEGFSMGQEKGIELGKRKGQRAEYSRMINALTEKKTQFILNVINIAYAVGGILSLAGVAALVYLLYIIIFKGTCETLDAIEKNLNNSGKTISIILTIMGTLGFISRACLKKLTNEDGIRKWCEQGYKNKIPYNMMDDIEE